MRRFAFLAVVACVWGGVLSGTGRADTVTYDLYSGGTSGTLEAEFVVQNYLVNGSSLNPFTPSVLNPGVTSPGELDAFTAPPHEAEIIYFSNVDTSFVRAFLTTADLPSSPGTYALDTSDSIVTKGVAFPTLAVLDTLVVTAPTPEPASLTLFGIGAVGLIGYGWRKRRQSAV
jgi:hypothetical protein